MGELRGFLSFARAPDPQRDPSERTRDYREVFTVLPQAELRRQGGRCMDCGIPFCHQGCPLGNLIPDWNDLVYRDRWREAIDRLHATNDFPEFTGITCPAPCEAACVLEINDDPVMIKQIEWAIVERAFEEGWVVPRPPARRSGRSVGVIGSGPAGLAAANQLNRAGHHVIVYERDEALGGLLRFGIPDFKLEKRIIERRLAVLEQEGIEFRVGVEVGVDVGVEELRATHDALVLAVGARLERELEVPGNDLDGVHFAMEYLYQRNRAVAAAAGATTNGGGGASGQLVAAEAAITAAGKHVLVIGGGDTAADCIANAHREHPLSVTQLDIYPEPAGSRPREITTWPHQPKRLPSTYALDEGGRRESSRSTTELVGTDGRLTHVRGVEVGGPPEFARLRGTEFEQRADLVLIAIGFTRPAYDGPIAELGLATDQRGNVDAPDYATSHDGVFAAGDARRGQSIVVWAINEGRQCARAVDRYLAWLDESATLEHPTAGAHGAEPAAALVPERP